MRRVYRSPPSRRRREGGFTLIEVLVALAVVATGISAMVTLSGGAADRAGRMDSRVLGTWTAANRLAELRLVHAWPGPGITQTQSAEGGRRWYLRENVQATADPDLRRIDIQVFGDEAQTDEVANLFGYLAKPNA
jgi:general secretion pathway protein I